MSQIGATLLVSSTALFGLAVFAWLHRRDALGAALALALGFDAAAAALVGFAELVQTASRAAQLQAFAVVVELLGVLFVAGAAALAQLLRRRGHSGDLLELWSLPAAATVVAAPAESEPAEVGAVDAGAAELEDEREPGPTPEAASEDPGEGG
ncbi:MAG: hypothetical protein ACREOL_03435 [Candidatus Dormibacteria bacterium]